MNITQLKNAVLTGAADDALLPLYCGQNVDDVRARVCGLADAY